MIRFSIVVMFFVVSLGFSQTKTGKEKSRFPNEINQMFNAHGSYLQWSKMHQLSFDLIKKSGEKETHLIELKSRKSLITSSNFVIGFDGHDVWLNKESKFPATRARFYHNLYFYFYAMPFVLGDPGITYSRVNDLKFEGKNYPGFKISYNTNVGDSPDDNYFIYFDKNTHQMVWLGYTVTYGDNKPSTEIHYIKYTDWTTVNGLLLPRKLQWYDSKNNLPNTPSNSVEFDNISVLKDKVKMSKFKKPTDALIGEK